MANGYTRQAAGNIAAGLPIQSADLNAEFNQLVNTFNISTGHNHDGSTAGAGPPLALTSSSLSGTLPISKGGTGSTTAFANGSILLISNPGTPVVVEDSGSLYYDKTNHKLGLLNNQPQCTITVGSITSGTGEPTNGGSIQIQHAGGASLTGGKGLEFKVQSGSSGTGWMISSPDLTGSNVPLVFSSRTSSATWVNRGRMDQNGAFSWGDGTNNAYRFSVLAAGISSAADYIAKFANSNNTAGDGVVLIGGGPNSSDTSTNLITFLDGGANTIQGTVKRNGAAAVSFNTTSDVRFKDNIVDTTTGVSALMNIQVRDFNFKMEPDKTQQGLIAQEVYEVYPYCVSVGQQILEPWGIDYGRLTPLIIKSIQDLYVQALGEIATLTARIEALENNVP